MIKEKKRGRKLEGSVNSVPFEDQQKKQVVWSNQRGIMGQMINTFKYFKGYKVENGTDLLYMATEDKSRKNIQKLEIFV